MPTVWGRPAQRSKALPPLKSTSTKVRWSGDEPAAILARCRAALAFGDMTLIDQEIEWARGMLANTGRFDEGTLERYLSAYAQAACEQLDEACRPIIDWLCS